MSVNNPLDFPPSDEELMASKGNRGSRTTVGGPGPGGGPGGNFPGYAGMAPVSGFTGFDQSNLPIVLRKKGFLPGVTPGKPGPSDTVPAMLTPGEIVMNPGVTANPELANALLALNQYGASNMQSGVGPVGMEYGGRVPLANILQMIAAGQGPPSGLMGNEPDTYRMVHGGGHGVPLGAEYGGYIPGYGLGGAVSSAFKKAGSWLKHNVNLKNYGKYVGANALVAGAILGAPVVAGAAGAGAAGSGAAGAGAAGSGAAGSGAAGAGGTAGAVANTAKGITGWLKAHPKVAKAIGSAVSSSSEQKSQQQAALTPITGNWQGYQGIQQQSYNSPDEQGGYAEGGMVPGQEVPMGMMEQGGPAIQPGMEQMGAPMGGPEMGGMEEMGPEAHENPYPSSAVRILQLLLELDEAEQAEYGGMGGEGHEFGGIAGYAFGGGVLGRLRGMRNMRFGKFFRGNNGAMGAPGAAPAPQGGFQGMPATFQQRFPGMGNALMQRFQQARQQRLGSATPGQPQGQGFGWTKPGQMMPPSGGVMAPASNAQQQPPQQPQQPQQPNPAASTGMAYGGMVPGFEYGGEVSNPFGEPVPGYGFGGWIKKRFKMKKAKKVEIDPYKYAQQQAGDIAAARQAGYFDPRGNQALIRGMEEGARGTADALVRRQMSQAQLGGMDPAQQAVARQQALLQTGRGVQDIMAITRANALAGQDQFFKNMYGGAASAAEQARLQNDMARRQQQQQGGVGNFLGGLAGKAVGNYVGSAASAAGEKAGG